MILASIIVINTAIFYAIHFQTNYQIITKTIEEESNDYLIQISYPWINYYKEAGDKFNLFVFNQIQSQIDQFKANIGKNSTDITLKTNTISKDKNKLYIKYSLLGFSRGYVSVIFRKEESFVNNNPSYYFWSLNYSFKTANDTNFASLFKPNSNYVEILSNYIYRNLIYQLKENQIKDKNPYLSQEKSINSEIQNLKTFAITDNALLIYLNSYQDNNPLTIAVPYLILREVINPDQLLKNFVK